MNRVFPSLPVARSARTSSPTARSTASSDRYWLIRRASMRASWGALNGRRPRTHAGLSETSASSKLGGRHGARSAKAVSSPGAGVAGPWGAAGAK